MIALAPLQPGMSYSFESKSAVAPYVVIGTEAPLPTPDGGGPHSQGAAQLLATRTLALQGGALALTVWQPSVPWQTDAARLTALRERCAQPGAALVLRWAATAERIEVHLGRCSLIEPLAAGALAPPLLAALAGPQWLTMRRQPDWSAQRQVVWQIVALVVAKVAAICWGLGLASAIAVSVALGAAALVVPVPAVLTWPLTLIVGVAAVLVRVAVLGLRYLPRRWLVPAVIALSPLALTRSSLVTSSPIRFRRSCIRVRHMPGRTPVRSWGTRQ